MASLCPSTPPAALIAASAMFIPPSASTPKDAADPVSGSVAPMVQVPPLLLPEEPLPAAAPAVEPAVEPELEPASELELEHAASVPRTVRPAIASQSVR